VCAALGLLLATSGIFIAPRLGLDLSARAVVILWAITLVSAIFLAFSSTHHNSENAKKGMDMGIAANSLK
jgi:amino acid transporter